MIKNIQKYLCLCLMLMIFPGQANTDGMLLPFHDEDLYESSQIALIVFDNGKEDIYLNVEHEGDSINFAWIIPTPTLPEVDAVDFKLFTELHEVTKPIVKKNTKSSFMNNIDKEISDDIQLYFEDKVGTFDVAVLSASGSDSLYNWLENKKYNIPKEAEKLLDWYIEKKWYFTVMKIGNENSQYNKFLSKMEEKFGEKNNVENYAEIMISELINSLKNERLTEDNYQNAVYKLKISYPELSFNLAFNDEFQAEEKDIIYGFKQDCLGFNYESINKINDNYDFISDPIFHNFIGSPSAEDDACQKYGELMLENIKTKKDPVIVYEEINDLLAKYYAKNPDLKKDIEDTCKRAVQYEELRMMTQKDKNRAEYIEDHDTGVYCIKVDDQYLLWDRIDSKRYQLQYKKYHREFDNERIKLFTESSIIRMKNAIRKLEAKEISEMKQKIHPIKLSFSNESIIYPLKISQFSAQTIESYINELIVKNPNLKGANTSPSALLDQWLDLCTNEVWNYVKNDLKYNEYRDRLIFSNTLSGITYKGRSFDDYSNRWWKHNNTDQWLEDEAWGILNNTSEETLNKLEECGIFANLDFNKQTIEEDFINQLITDFQNRTPSPDYIRNLNMSEKECDSNSFIDESRYHSVLHELKTSFPYYTEDGIKYDLKRLLKTSVPDHIKEGFEQDNKTNQILLYVLTDHKVTAPKFETEYAGWIDSRALDQIEKKINNYEIQDLNELRKIIDKKYFLTKMRRFMSKEEMNDDLLILPTGNNNSEHLTTYGDPIDNYYLKQNSKESNDDNDDEILEESNEDNEILENSNEDDHINETLNDSKTNHYEDKKNPDQSILNNQHIIIFIAIGISSIALITFLIKRRKNQQIDQGNSF